jgi:predicted RND superfamily exporter protein
LKFQGEEKMGDDGVRAATFVARLKHAANLEHHFEQLGRSIVRRPKTLIGLSLISTLILAGGWTRQFNESRPDKQWVPRDAVALTHKAFVERVWPGELSFSLWIAVPADAGANMLSAPVIKELWDIEERIKTIKVDGRKETLKYFGTVPVPAETLALVDGIWSYDEDSNVQRKCYKFGPTCGQTTLSRVFNNDDEVIGRLSDESALIALNAWEQQAFACPVSIAREDSPCIDPSAWVAGADDKDCQKYNTVDDAGRGRCAAALSSYCAEVCPSRTDPDCHDGGCGAVLQYDALAATVPGFVYPYAFMADFEGFKLKQVASSSARGPSTKRGKVTSADAVRGAFFLEFTPITVGGEQVDIVGDAWEREALCVLGIPAGDYTAADCPLPEHVRFTALFSRSFGDAFGAALSGDISKLIIAIIGIAAYLILMISPCDPVHSMIGISLTTIAIALLSFVCSTGLGSYAGIFTSQLSNLVPFLILGLGVDDAFVLIGEYNRATLAAPTSSAEDRVIAATKHGGVSIMITSLTDALAFLIGSSTLLPALESFCIYAGIAIIVCFVFQLTIFLPVLLLDAKRADAKRYDMLCCLTSKREHDFADPKGGCCVAACTGVKFPKNTLADVMARFARAIMSVPGKVVVLVAFGAIFSIGIVGASRIYADFRLEWFIPDGSYVNSFFDINDDYFAGGTPFTVYTTEGDYFAQQRNLQELSSYLNKTNYIDQDEDISDWSKAFFEYAKDTDKSWLDKSGRFEVEENYYRQLITWLQGAGVAYSSSVQWLDRKCDEGETWRACDEQRGIRATRISAVTNKAVTDVGRDRYATLIALRTDIAARMPGAFPYGSAFIFWEETGVIGPELVRNLGICIGVIIGVVGLLIQERRAALLVIISVLMAVAEIVGYLHWWDVTISSVSTIYILIAVGLTVDYSAHIAHMFVVSEGTRNERAIASLSRIGPSVFNAVVSTLVAVCALSTSDSYVFRVFFKALALTVLLGGSHGLILLPVLLSVFGDSKNSAGAVAHAAPAVAPADYSKTEAANEPAAVPAAAAQR